MVDFIKNISNRNIRSRSRKKIGKQLRKIRTVLKFIIAMYSIFYLVINNKRKIAWVLRVVKLSGWIGLGVCIKDKIVGAGYKFTYENLGHGSYLISSNGYTWSSSKQANNSAYVGSFNFTTNDYIVV